MFCVKCGSQIPRTAEYCSTCGAFQPNGAQAPVAPSQSPPPEAKKKSSKKIWIILICVAVAVLLIYWFFFRNRPQLKYDWGTDMQTVIDDGWVEEIEADSYSDFASVYVFDKDHSVDQITECLMYSAVEYFFYDEELIRILYEYNSSTYEEMRDVFAGYYGNDYCQISDDATYWWIGDTVVHLSGYGYVCYYDEEAFVDILPVGNAKKVQKYFGK